MVNHNTGECDHHNSAEIVIEIDEKLYNLIKEHAKRFNMTVEATASYLIASQLSD